MHQPAPAPQPGVERQQELYRAGRPGPQGIPVSIEDVERRAKEQISHEAYDYVAGGAGSEDTMRANLEAFRRWRLEPRMLRDVHLRDLTVQVLGTDIPFGVLLAPVGALGCLAQHPELTVARAAAGLRVPFTLTSVSSTPMEHVAQAMGPVPAWFQLYWSKEPEIAASFVRRAEQAGFRAIVVTVDTPILAWRERDLSQAYLPFMHGHGLANYFSDPVFRSQLARPPEQDPAAAIQHFLGIFGNPALTWDGLTFLRQHTRLPVVLKGIVSADDAARAVDAGVDGIIVSNHGGRQVDGAVGALDALPRVVDALRGRMPVLFDSGIRRGADVLKALALGARAVFLGRPYVWGLAAAGEEGVRHVLANLRGDLDLTLALCGLTALTQVDRSVLRSAY